jgi:hypothetical protein
MFVTALLHSVRAQFGAHLRHCYNLPNGNPFVHLRQDRNPLPTGETKYISERCLWVKSDLEGGTRESSTKGDED